MAHVVNTNTRLARRALRSRICLVALYLVGSLVAASLLRGILIEIGGLDHIRQGGIGHAVTTAFSRVFSFPGGHLPPPHARHQLLLLGLHLAGLGVVSQVIWLPISVLRSHRAQRRVLRELQRLPEEYWVLNDLSVPGLHTPSQVDHVIVSPYGLWCLETRADSGTITGGEYDYEWLQFKRPTDEPKRAHAFYNPLRRNCTHCDHLRDHLVLQRLEAPVRSMIVFTAANVDAMTITPVETIGNAVQSILRADTERVLDRHTVERIVGSLSSLLATRHGNPSYPLGAAASRVPEAPTG